MYQKLISYHAGICTEAHLGRYPYMYRKLISDDARICTEAHLRLCRNSLCTPRCGIDLRIPPSTWWKPEINSMSVAPTTGEHAWEASVWETCTTGRYINTHPGEEMDSRSYITHIDVSSTIGLRPGVARINGTIEDIRPGFVHFIFFCCVRLGKC